MNEGYIKFDYLLIDGPPLSFDVIEDINDFRTELWDKGLLGTLPDGISFGNISKRASECLFIISGSNTGKYRILQPEHYVCITEVNINSNLLVCNGKVPPSSEALTHSAIYSALPSVNFVVHFHNSKIWAQLVNKFPTTNPKAEYGTIELAKELGLLCKLLNPQKDNIVVLGGHRDGIVAFAENITTLREKVVNLLDYQKQI
jgi:hypothetical protein